MDNKKINMENLYPYFKGKNSILNLMNNRMGNLGLPNYKLDTVEGAIDIAHRCRVMRFKTTAPVRSLCDDD